MIRRYRVCGSLQTCPAAGSPAGLLTLGFPQRGDNGRRSSSLLSHEFSGTRNGRRSITTMPAREEPQINPELWTYR